MSKRFFSIVVTVIFIDETETGLEKLISHIAEEEGFLVEAVGAGGNVGEELGFEEQLRIHYPLILSISLRMAPLRYKVQSILLALDNLRQLK